MLILFTVFLIHMIKLTEYQTKFKPAIDWLISDDAYGTAGTGRSFLLAYCFIRKAMAKPPETWIRFFDHYSSLNDDIMFREMEGILKEDFPYWKLEIKNAGTSRRSFRLVKKEQPSDPDQ